MRFIPRSLIKERTRFLLLIEEGRGHGHGRECARGRGRGRGRGRELRELEHIVSTKDDAVHLGWVSEIVFPNVDDFAALVDE